MYEKRIPAELTDVSVYKDEDGIFLSITYKNAEFDGERRDVYIPKVRLPIPMTCLPTIRFEESGMMRNHFYVELNGPICLIQLEAESTNFHLKSALEVEVEVKEKCYAEVRQEKIITKEEAGRILKQHFGCPVKIENRSQDCFEYSDLEGYGGAD